MKNNRRNEENIYDEQSIIKYMANKEEKFKLIKDDSFDKNLRAYSFESFLKIRENKIKKFLLNCYKNNCKKDDLIITVVVILSIICYHFGLTKCEKDPSECTMYNKARYDFLFHNRFNVSNIRRIICNIYYNEYISP